MYAFLLLPLIISPIQAQSEPSQQVIFTSNRENRDEWHLYSINADGSNLQQVVEPGTPEQDFSYGAELSPDGRTLAYVSNYCYDRDCTHFTIDLMNLETKIARTLTADSNESWAPHWSPNGQYLAYYSGMTFPYAAIIDVETGNLVLDMGPEFLRPLGGSSAGRVLGMSWASDSQRIVISVDNPNQGTLALYVVALNGQVEKISEEMPGWFPAWQPDSEIIYYRCVGTGTRYDLCRINLATQEWEVISQFRTEIESLDILPFSVTVSDVNDNGDVLLNITSGEELDVWDIYYFNTTTNVLYPVITGSSKNLFPRWHTTQ
jgi:Tol biopolymer transport system component